MHRSFASKDTGQKAVMRAKGCLHDLAEIFEHQCHAQGVLKTIAMRHVSCNGTYLLSRVLQRTHRAHDMLAQ
jgi:hypothetical protein